MTRRNRIAYRLARFFFERAGDAGVDPYMRLEAQMEAQYRNHTRYIRKLELELAPLRMIADQSRQLTIDLALVDGLLSQKQYDEAQKFLRVALIKARRLRDWP